MIIKNLSLILSFLFFYFISLILKRFFFPSEIFYYESINLLFLYSIFIIILITLFFKILKKNLLILVNSLIIFILLTYSILITFPTLSKRSLSLFLLNNLEKNIEINNGATDQEILKLFQNEFLDEDGQILIRLNEQLNSKNIYQRDQKYFITNRGIFINKINTILIRIFNL